jgi:Ice-binding-like
MDQCCTIVVRQIPQPQLWATGLIYSFQMLRLSHNFPKYNERNHVMKKLLQYFLNGMFVLATLISGGATAWADVTLGDASEFSVLGGSNVTCTGGVIAGDVGVAPGGAVPFTNTGCSITGMIPPATDAAAVLARTDFLSAYAAMWQLSSSCIALPGNLADQNLAPGVYCLDAGAKTGTLTLSGPADAEWIFLVSGALTGTDFNVVMAGGGEPCNVYWAPTAAVTMTTSALKGNILAGNPIGGSVTITGGTVAGQIMANVAVTMTNTSVIGCDVLSPDPVCKDHRNHRHDHKHKKCNQGRGNGAEGCDPGNSNHHHDSNDENGNKRSRKGY